MSRPTKYKEEYNQKILDLMKEGCSIAEICLELDICKQTFYNWCEQNKEFLDSKKKGEDFSEGWWMKQGRLNLTNKDFSYTGWYMNMKNRFGWRDKSEIENTHTVTPNAKEFIDDLLK
jgi:hypothetical protein